MEDDSHTVAAGKVAGNRTVVADIVAAGKQVADRTAGIAVAGSPGLVEHIVAAVAAAVAVEQIMLPPRAPRLPFSIQTFPGTTLESRVSTH